MCVRVHCAVLEEQPRCVLACAGVWGLVGSRRVTAVIASRKRPVPFRTRKLSSIAPMVLHSGGCGRVGRRRTSFTGSGGVAEPRSVSGVRLLHSLFSCPDADGRATPVPSHDEDVARAWEVAAPTQTGTTWINRDGAVNPRAPFSRIKHSGQGRAFAVPGRPAAVRRPRCAHRPPHLWTLRGP